VKRVECKILLRKPEGMTPHGKPRRRLEDNIKIGIKGTGAKVWNEFIWLRNEQMADCRVG